jgi:hypothetical protein
LPSPVGSDIRRDMISSRLAFHVARLHRWLGLFVGLQVLVWTATGLFFAAIPIERVRGEHLWTPPAQAKVDLSRVGIGMDEALAAVAEDQPTRVNLRMLGSRPVYEIVGDIGVFVVSAADGEILSPLSEELAREAALAAWKGPGALNDISLLQSAPMESGHEGPVWAARFDGPGHPVLYVQPTNGAVGPIRTDLWRTYDLLWSLHIMDYQTRENFNHPLIIAAAILALSLTLFGIILVLHRFLRARARPAVG